MGGTVVQMLEAVNFWGASQDVSGTQSAGTTYRFFAGQSGGDFNDLGAEGYLPENRQGKVIGLFVSLNALVSATNATAGQDTRFAIEFIRNCEVRYILNSRLVVRGPMYAFPHPPTWVQGTQPGGAAGEGAYVAQNGGYMLAFSPLEFLPRFTHQVEVRVKRTMSGSQSSTHNMDVWLQTLDKVVL